MADLHRFVSDFLTGDPPRVLAFSCEEQLNQPFVLRVYVDHPAPLGDLEGALGQPGSLEVGASAEGGAGTVFHGLLFQADLLIAVGERRIYRLTLAPGLRALEIGHHSRVFVDKSVPEVIEEILKQNAPLEYELRLSRTYGKRPHICQYKESDLQFLHRWMEREGICYFHSHGDGGAKLILCDDKARHDDIAEPDVRYHPSGQGDAIALEAITSFRRVHAAVTENVELGDYDHQKPALRIGASKASVAIGFEDHVRFEDNLHDPSDADQQAAVYAERLAAQQVRFYARGRVRGLHAGLCFALTDHPREGFNQRYQLCRVTHHGTVLQSDPELSRRLGLPPSPEGYNVILEALPADVQYRPERSTPWPAVYGVESAMVDGEASSPYAQLDPEGRYRVRLLFDEAKSPDGSASAWIRMLQPHGGSPEGHHFPLRKGTEVLVGFVHGDPDRPFIMGAAPTPRTPSTVTGANSTQNVIQTGSLNRLEIEDQDGAQYIDISSPPEKTFVHLGVHAGLGDHNIVVSTDGDGLHHAGGNRDLTVGGDQTEDVTGDVVEKYAANQTTHVFAAFDETISSGKTQTISAGSTQSIDGGLTQTIDGGETRTVNGGLTETISGGRTQDIVGSSTETISGSLTQTISGFVGISTPATYVLNAAASITMMTPASGKLSGIGGVSVIAPAGQMTVDSLYEMFGQQNILAFGGKLTIGAMRVAITASWNRAQGAHGAVLGVKVDVKVVDSKNLGKDNDIKYGALTAKPAPVSPNKNTLTEA